MLTSKHIIYAKAMEEMYGFVQNSGDGGGDNDDDYEE